MPTRLVQIPNAVKGPRLTGMPADSGQSRFAFNKLQAPQARQVDFNTSNLSPEIQAAYNRKGASRAANKVDAKAMAAPAEAMAQLGQGIIAGGEGLQVLGQRIIDAKNYVVNAEAQQEATIAFAQFKAGLKGREDYEAWGDDWNQQLNGIIEKYSERAVLWGKGQIRVNLERMGASQSAQLISEATQISTGRERNTILNEAERMASYGYPDAAAAKIDEGIDRGVIFAEEGEPVKRRYREQAEARNLEQQIKANPANAENLIAQSDLPVETKDKARETGLVEMQNRRKSSVSFVEKLIDDRKITTVAQLEEFMANPNMADYHTEDDMDALRARVTKVGMTSPEAQIDVIREVTAFDPKSYASNPAGMQQKAQDLRSMINKTFPPGEREVQLKRVEDALAGSPKKPYEDLANSVFTQAYNAGKFGPLPTPLSKREMAKGIKAAPGASDAVLLAKGNMHGEIAAFNRWINDPAQTNVTMEQVQEHLAQQLADMERRRTTTVTKRGLFGEYTEEVRGEYVPPTLRAASDTVAPNRNSRPAAERIDELDKEVQHGKIVEPPLPQDEGADFTTAPDIIPSPGEYTSPPSSDTEAEKARAKAKAEKDMEEEKRRKIATAQKAQVPTDKDYLK